MLGRFALDVVSGALLVAGWYLWFRRDNRRRGAQILRWIHFAFAGQGTISQMRWQGASRFDVELRLSPSVFQRASLSVKLRPREMPLNWLLSVLRRERETGNFRSRAGLQSGQHPCTSTVIVGAVAHAAAARPQGGLGIRSLGPLVISTRDDWHERNCPTAGVGGGEPARRDFCR